MKKNKKFEEAIKVYAEFRDAIAEREMKREKFRRRAW